MWNDTVWRVNGEKESKMLREAEHERLVNMVRRANASKRGGYRLHLRQTTNRLWALRWQIMPVMLRSPRKIASMDTEELPCIPGYEC